MLPRGAFEPKCTDRELSFAMNLPVQIDIKNPSRRQARTTRRLKRGSSRTMRRLNKRMGEEAISRPAYGGYST